MGYILLICLMPLNGKSYLLSGGTPISSNSDMNNYTEIGNYYANSKIAQSLQNEPFNRSFTMKIDYGNGTGYICQTYREIDTGRIAIRYNNNQVANTDQWQPYVYFSDDSSLFYGKRIQSGDNLNDYRTPGIYCSISSTVSTTLLNMPETLSAGFSLLVLQFSTGTVIQVIFKGAMADAIYTRSITSSGWQPWHKYAGEKIEA